MTAHPSVQLPLCLAHYLNYHENTAAQPPRARLSRKSLAAAAQFSKPIFTVTDQLIPLARSLALTLFSLLSSFNAIHERDGERAVVRLSGRRRCSCHRVMLSLRR